MSEITDLRNEMMLMFGKMDQRFDGIDQRLDGMDQRFDGIDRRLDGMDQRFDGIDRRLDGMDQRFDGIDRRLDGIDQRLDGMDQRFDGIDRHLDGMNQRLDKIDKNLREGFLDLSNTIGTALKDHEERLDSIENCMKNVSLMLQTRPETSSNFKNSMLL